MKFLSKIILFLIFNFLFFSLYSIDIPNNLIIKKLKEGDENKKAAENNDFISVKYSGWLFDNNSKTKEVCDAKGNMFDSNIDRDEAFEFVLGQGIVIKGWDKGLQNMKVNEKRCLVIPPKFAYGNRRIGNIIKPNSTLIFEVELVKVM